MYHDADAVSIVVIAAVALIQMTMTTAFMLPTTHFHQQLQQQQQQQPRLAAPSRDSTTRIFLEGKEGSNILSPALLFLISFLFSFSLNHIQLLTPAFPLLL